MLSVQLFATRRGGASAVEVLDDLIAQAMHAERAGFHTVWLAEHHRTDWNLCSDPLTVLAAIASSTVRIRLGAAVVNLNLQEPVRVAEQAALVNAISRGRLELGLGRGFARADYQLYGQSQEAMTTGWFLQKYEELRLFLSTDTASSDIPTWIASSGSRQTVQAAVDHGAGLLLAASGEKLAKIANLLRRTPARPKVGLARAVHLGADRTTAVEELLPYLAWYRNALSRLQSGTVPPSLTEVLETFCIVGTADDCVDQVNSLTELYPFDQLICIPGIGGMGEAIVGRVLDALGSAAGPRSQSGQ